jgi:RNA polymerase sigma-70 factor (ECF subfamily)
MQGARPEHEPRRGWWAALTILATVLAFAAAAHGAGGPLKTGANRTGPPSSNGWMEGELELAARAAGGDESAFRTVVERHSRMVHTLGYRITADPATAEDVVQETFLRVHRAVHRFDGRASLASWIGRIATNVALDVVRARRHRREVAYEEEGVVKVPAPSAEPGPERVATSADVRRALARAMRALTPVERAAFELRHFEGRHTEEIAAA